MCGVSSHPHAPFYHDIQLEVVLQRVIYRGFLNVLCRSCYHGHKLPQTHAGTLLQQSEMSHVIRSVLMSLDIEDSRRGTSANGPSAFLLWRWDSRVVVILSTRAHRRMVRLRPFYGVGSHKLYVDKQPSALFQSCRGLRSRGQFPDRRMAYNTLSVAVRPSIVKSFQIKL